MTHPVWPLFDLRVRTPRLELRPPSDDDLVALALNAAEGVHPPDQMPFMVPWTRESSPRLERGVLQWVWRQRADWSVDDWTLPLAVVLDGAPIGLQDIGSKAFAVTRRVGTGSWLGRRWQGRGLGTEMRAAVLHLAFAGLGARLAVTAAWEDNASSLGVTRRLGYEEDGWTIEAREGRPARSLRFRMDRARWESTRRLAVDIDGLDACLAQFGAGPEPAPGAAPQGGPATR